MKQMKQHMRTAFTSFLLVALLSLGGCFNFSGEEAQQPEPGGESSVYQTNDFSINIPADWEVIDENDFTPEVPDETVAVFRNNVKNENFTANVNVVQRGIQSPVTSMEYANLVNNRQKSGLVDYRETRKETISIASGDQKEDTYFIAFEARKSSSDPLIRYFQTYGVRGNSAYIVTGALSTQENESTVQTVEKIVRSFRLR